MVLPVYTVFVFVLHEKKILHRRTENSLNFLKPLSKGWKEKPEFSEFITTEIKGCIKDKFSFLVCNCYINAHLYEKSIPTLLKQTEVVLSLFLFVSTIFYGSHYRALSTCSHILNNVKHGCSTLHHLPYKDDKTVLEYF